MLEAAGISVSMTESGGPYDNAIAERVNGILKTEFGLDNVFKDYDQASRAIDRAIKRYNKLRPHMSCGYLTPDQAHRSKKTLSKLWKKRNYVRMKPKELNDGRDKSYSDMGADPSKVNTLEVGNNFYTPQNF